MFLGTHRVREGSPEGTRMSTALSTEERSVDPTLSERPSLSPKWAVREPSMRAIDAACLIKPRVFISYKLKFLSCSCTHSYLAM